MSYIQVKDLGGKDRGLKFNQLALEVFDKHVDLEFVATTAAYATFYAGLRGNSHVKKEEVDYTYEEVCGWVDKLASDDRVEEFNKVEKVWIETHEYKKWLEGFSDRIRALIKPIEEVPDKPKKKMKRNSTGSRYTNSHLVT